MKEIEEKRDRDSLEVYEKMIDELLIICGITYDRMRKIYRDRVIAKKHTPQVSEIFLMIDNDSTTSNGFSKIMDELRTQF